MAVFTVFEPPQKDRDIRDHAARFAFVRDGFSWRAFAFGPLWMLRHRLWLSLFIYAIVVSGLFFTAYVMRLSDGFEVIIMLLIAMLIGLESATLRRWKLHRWRDHGIVVAEDEQMAERRFFDNWADASTASQPSEFSAPTNRPYSPSTRDHGSDIIGLFPEPGAQQ
jgi:hypothetical protein